MFTDPPPLVERIARKFDDIRVIDGMSRLSLDAPSASSLAGLLDHPALIRELRSVGMPLDLVSSTPSEAPVTLVKARLPYLRKIRNTSASWRLYRILNDLYDYTEPEIRESDVQALNELIARNAVAPEWAGDVLAERCRIDRVVCDSTSRSQGINPATAEDRLGIAVSYCWDASGLLSYDHPRADAHKHITKPGYLDTLEHVLGRRPKSTADLAKAVGDFLSRTVTGQVRFISTRLSTKVRLAPPDEGQIDHLIDREQGGVPLTDEETDQLMSTVAWSIFTWAHENKRAVQLTGLGRSPHQPYSCPASLVRLTSAFEHARFVLADYARDFARHAHHLAAARPNIAIAGYADSVFVTSLIAAESSERLQVVPIGKAIGFLSQAPSVEWIYGNLQLVRRGLARGLASAVEDDHIHENQVHELIAAMLQHSASEILDLS